MQRKKTVAQNNLPAPYPLTERSKEASREFGNANQAAALLYRRFKQIDPYPWKRERLNKLKRLVLRIIRTGPESLKGNRKLWDGDLRPFLDYALNVRRHLSSHFTAKGAVSVDPVHGLRFTLAPFKAKDVFRYPPRACFSEYTLYCLSFDLETAQSEAKKMVVFKHPIGEDLDEEIVLQLPVDPLQDRLILLVESVRFYYLSSQKEISVIGDRYYQGTDVKDIFRMKDGKRVVYEVEKAPEHRYSIPSVGEWSDLG